MKYQFSEIVDIPKLQKLMEGLYTLSGIPSFILDPDGDILVAVGFHEICVKYHRENSETERLCRKSDRYITKYLKEHPESNEPYIYYTCANGLISAGAPIRIDGEHVATIFQGQFLLQEPDIERFRRQAGRYGFDEEEYLKALAKVPIYTKDKLDSIMHYFRYLAEHLAEIGMTKLRMMETQAKTLCELQSAVKSVLDNSPHLTVRVFDKERQLCYINRAAEKIYNFTFEEIKNKKIRELGFDFKTARALEKMIAQAEETSLPVGPVEWNFNNNAGVEKHLYTTVFPISLYNNKEFICLDIDISERKQMEHELARMEKLNLVGEMAAGIGHEVRNPMTTVRGFLQLLEEKEECVKHKDYYSLMIDELDRANSIITEFLALAKDKAIKRELKDLNAIISSVAPLIEANVRTINQNIKFELGYIPKILLDEQEIKQLILNLAHNGMEAMDSGGCLTIKTYVEKNEVVLSVADQGQGISPEFLDKLGSPFFSTKENGTGLGLAVCYSIAARHKAHIALESGKLGTKFFVRFKAKS